jgi:hypothetical protein
MVAPGEKEKEEKQKEIQTSCVRCSTLYIFLNLSRKVKYTYMKKNIKSPIYNI